MIPEPLRYNVPIVDPANGTPTTGFQRIWQLAFPVRGVTLRPAIDQQPLEIGDLVITMVNDTTLSFRYKGSDGIVRSNDLTLT